MEPKNVRLVATDLDGTFLRNDQTISQGNLEALEWLGRKNITRVVATGRNLRKVFDVLPPEVPFDYIVFSSGAGVYNWKEKKHLYSQNIAPASTARLIRHFLRQQLNFYAFAAAPENHRLWFHRGKEECPEFNKYLTYHPQAGKFPSNGGLKGELCQFLLIIPEDESAFAILKEEIESQCEEIRVIRSSSPVTRGYIWVEVFHRNVSKGNGVYHVCTHLGIDPLHTIGIGNDYNDLDLLRFTAHSFLAGNAPVRIKEMFTLVPSNEEDAFAHAIKPLLI